MDSVLLVVKIFVIVHEWTGESEYRWSDRPMRDVKLYVVHVSANEPNWNATVKNSHVSESQMFENLRKLCVA